MAPLALGICRYAVVEQDAITGSWLLAEDGCPHTGSEGERQAHEEACGYRPKECQHCQQMMKAREVQAHEEQCDYRRVHCSHLGCNAEVLALILNVHEDECEYRLVSCPLCTEKVAVRDRKEHSHVCEYRLVPCPRCDVMVAACLVESSHQPECRPNCPLCGEAFLFNEGEEHFKVCPEAVTRCPKSGCPVEGKRGDTDALTMHVLTSHGPVREVDPAAEPKAAEGEERAGPNNAYQGADPLENGAATTGDAAPVPKNPSLSSQSTSGLARDGEPPVPSNQNNREDDTSPGAYVTSLGLDLLAVVAETKQDLCTAELSARGKVPTADPAEECATGQTAIPAGEGATNQEQHVTPDSEIAEGVPPGSLPGAGSSQEQSVGLVDGAPLPEVGEIALGNNGGEEMAWDEGGDQSEDDQSVVVPARFRVQSVDDGAPPTPSQTSPSPILIEHDDRDPPAVKALQLLRADRKAWSEADNLIKDDRDLLALEHHVEAEGRAAVRSDLLRAGRVKKREEGETLVKLLWGFRCGFLRLFLYILTGLRANRGGKPLKGQVLEQIVEALGCSRVVPDGFCQQLQSDKKPRGRPPKDSAPGQAQKRGKGLDGSAQKRKKLDELGDINPGVSDSDSDAPIGKPRRKLSSRRQKTGAARKLLGSILDGMEEEDGPLFRTMLRVADRIESAPDEDTDKPMNLIRIRNKINGKQLDVADQQSEYTLHDLSEDMQLISEHTYDMWSGKDAERIAEQARRLHLLFVRNRDSTQVKNKLARMKAAG